MPRRSFPFAAPKILFQNVGDTGSAQYRTFTPASLLRRHGYAVAQAHPHTITPDALKVLDPDVIVFQLHQTKSQQEKIKAYRKACREAFFVYEIDDLFWGVPEGSWHYQTNPLLPTARANIKETARLCDAITVTTPRLADEMRRLTGMKDVRVVPNRIPQSFVNAALAGRRSSNIIKSDRPRVGWAGGVGHGGDLAVLTEVVRDTCDQIQWVFVGMLPPDITAETVEVHGGVHYAEYAELLGRLNLDLALAPLEDNPFNQCKSALRVLEYAAAGYPVIASTIATYEGCPVRFAANTPADWQAAIEAALADPKRNAEAEALHEWLLLNHLNENHLDEHLRGYLPKHAETFVPGQPRRCLGQVVTVSAEPIADLPRFDNFEDAWGVKPGADILFVRPGANIGETQAAKLISALDHAASVTILSNDCGYPDVGAFQAVPPDTVAKLNTAAQLAQGDPLERPYPSGPVAIFAGPALARFGLPDHKRFSSLEYSFADWGARAAEAGHKHLTLTDTLAIVHAPLQHPEALARRTVEHISMWSPGFVAALQAFQGSRQMAVVREDIDLAYSSLFYQGPNVTEYNDWYRMFCAVTDLDRAAMREAQSGWSNAPVFNIILPVYNTDHAHLRASIDSVIDQVYGQWQLAICNDGSTDPEIERILQVYFEQDIRIRLVSRETNGHICAASNDALNLALDEGWTIFLDHDDTLTPHALWLLAQEIVKHPEAQFIYTDSDKISPKGEYTDPYFAPDFSYELLLAQNYVTHLCAYRTQVVKKLRLQEGMEGSQDWDLVLRYLEQTCGYPPNESLIRHIPQIAYHWRQSENSVAGNIMSKPYAFTAGRRAVSDHLHRTEQTAFLAPNPVLPIFLLLRWMVPNPLPKVAVIILTRDNPVQFNRCLESLLGKTVYGNYQVTVVSNGVKTPALPPGNKVALVKTDPQTPFNFAALNNMAVERTDAEFICFLNDDTEILEQSWLMDLVGLARRPGVGAVGTKLLFPDNKVQHGGIVFRPDDQPPGASAVHVWQQLGVHDPGQIGRALITQPFSAVTAACMVIKRSVFLEVDGFDAEAFPVDFNDVDLGLRLRAAGYRNVVSAQAYVRHDAGSTKRQGRWDRRRMLAAERTLIERYPNYVDPYINPNLVFHPHMLALRSVPPSKPWLDQRSERRLLVNPEAGDIEQALHSGALPFIARLEGHYLVFSEPQMPNVPPLDLRESVTSLETILQKLDIRGVSFFGIGDGTLGAVGYFATLAEAGWPITCTKGAEQGNEHHYIDTTGWYATWNRLIRYDQRDIPAAAALQL